MSKAKDIMVVTPHPDDAEFGVAGTVARWTRDGKDVVYVVTTNGDKGSSDINVQPAALAKTREEEQLAAAKVLGVSEVVFLRYPDQGLEDTAEFRKTLVRQIRKFRPRTVVTCDPYRRYRWHRDHRITAQATMDAVFPYARDVHSYPDLVEEGLQPHKVKELLFWAPEEPNCKLDITETFNIKLAALMCHKSQVGGHGHEDLEGFLREWAETSAEGTAFALAEAFYRVEMRD